MRQGKKWSKNLSLELPHLPPLPVPTFPIRRPSLHRAAPQASFKKKGLTPLRGQIVNLNEETQMNNKSITPNPQQPVDRVPTGQLPSALAELSEAALSETNANVLPLVKEVGGAMACFCDFICMCSYDGDDE